MGQGVRTCMVRMHPYILPMSVTCVTARANNVLDVCVLRRHRCASRVPLWMSSAMRCVSMRLLLCPSAATVSARLLAGAARQRDASGGSGSAE